MATDVPWPMQAAPDGAAFVQSVDPSLEPEGWRRGFFLSHWPRLLTSSQSPAWARAGPGPELVLRPCLAHIPPMEPSSAPPLQPVFCSPGGCAQEKTNHLKVLAMGTDALVSLDQRRQSC